MIRVVAFLTGFVSLGAEVSFTKVCERLLGQTNVTVATVLVAWFLGLYFGSRSVGREARAGAGLARASLLRCGLAVLVTTFVLPWVSVLPVPEGQVAWLRVVAIGLVLIPSAWFAGRALPALASAWPSSEAGARTSGSRLGGAYATETFGAVVGALAAGFFLPWMVGQRGGLLVLAITGMIGSRLPVRVTATTTGEDPRDGQNDVWSAPVERRLLVAVAIAGGATMALELLWTRVLLFFVPGLTGAMAAVLGGILIGSSIGAALGAARARRGDGAPAVARVAASRALLVGAAGVAISLAVLPWLGVLVRAWPHPVGGGFRPGHELVVSFLVASLVTIIPTIGSGAAMALIAQASSRAPTRAAAAVYGASCLGSVIGIFVAASCAGSVVPIRLAIALCGVALVVAGGFLWQRQGRRVRTLAAAALAVAILLVPRDASLLAVSAEFQKSYARDREVVAVAEDTHVVASVVEMGPPGERALYTNAFLAASTRPEYGYMRMLGHLPVLLTDEPRRALVIAYGTGTTVGSLSLHSSVKEIDIAEISSAVLELAPWFEAVNRGVPYRGDAGKRVTVRIGDGRAILEQDGPAYDIITLEPLPPETPAAVHFYTREFYRSCRRRLADGGAVCQWIPIHTSDPVAFRTLLRTCAEEMPTTWLFLFDQCALLLGRGDADAKIPLAALEARSNEIAPDLRTARMEDAAAVLGAFVAGRDELLAATTDVSAMTDDFPTVSLRFARPNRESLDHLAENAALLAELAGDVGALLDVTGVAPADAAAFRGRLSAAVRSKRLLRRLRSIVGQDAAGAAALARQALEARPGDLEALAILGRPAAAPSARFGDDAVTRLLTGEEEDPRRLTAALEAVGDRSSIPARLLLPFLDHEDLDVRLKAMVAMSRRIENLRGYDPLANEEARREAIARIEGDLE